MIGDFLALGATAPRRHWPDVAAAIAAWLVDGNEPLAALSARLWRECGIPGPPCALADAGRDALRAPG